MEQRRYRLAVLMLVVALHVPALMALWSWTKPRASVRADTPLVVEFVLNAPSAPASPPQPRRSRERASPREQAIRPVVVATPAQPEPAPTPARLYADDGSLRISPQLAAQIAPPPVPEARNTFHLPAGDTWILRDRPPAIEFRDTVFAKAFLPDDMNPIEEACWRNKGLAFVLATLGSTDCAAPGQKALRPPPEMIVYGVDDGAEILRKHAAWARYNER